MTEAAEQPRMVATSFVSWWLQYATGILHLDGFESYIGQKENHHP